MLCLRVSDEHLSLSNSYNIIQAVEIPREAPSQLDDISSAMPWNVSASIRGSSVLRSAARAAVTVGGSTSGHSASRRFHPGSRLVSASPLQGRGIGIGPTQGYGHGRGTHSHGYSDLGLPGDDDLLGTDLPEFSEMDLYGIETGERPIPVAQMGGGLVTASGGGGGVEDVTIAARPRPLQIPQAHLDRDAFNFFAFVEDAITSNEGEIGIEAPGGSAGEEGAGGRETAIENVRASGSAIPQTKTITFETLLPPAENSAMVAAQGLLHMLTLASRNVLKVWQRESFGEIRMGMVQGHEGG